MNRKVITTIASCGLAISLLLSGCSNNKNTSNKNEVSTSSNEAIETVEATAHIPEIAESHFIEVQVRMANDVDLEWKESIEAKVGDMVEYQIHYKNTTEVAAQNVSVIDTLPTNMKIFSNPVLYNMTVGEDGLDLEDFTKKAVSIGAYGADAEGYVRFTAEIVDIDLLEGENTLRNWAQVGVEKVTFQDSADVVVIKSKATQAWGPQDREMFTWENPAAYPTFNSMTDNPSLGHESNFVRVRETDSGAKYGREVTLETGKEYEVSIYYHNNGAANYGSSVMADNVRVKANFPTELKAGETGAVKATISATNTTPLEVWDTAYVNAEEDLRLTYVPNSATLHNGSTGEYATDGTILDSESLFGDGAKVAYFSGSADHPNEGWGFIPGCNEYAGYITFRIVVEKR